MTERTIIGLVEFVTVYAGMKRKRILARIDTGASKSSMDVNLAGELGIGPAIKHAYVRSASGKSVRPVVRASVNVAGKLIATEFNIAKREHMKYKVLIGQNVLSKGKFLIDPLKEIPKL